MFTDQKEALPLVQKERILGKDIILVHHTISKVNQRQDHRDLNGFGAKLRGRLKRLKVAPRVITIASPIGKPQVVINKYCDLYDRILVFVTTQHSFYDTVRGISGSLCLSRQMDGPVQHITVSDLSDRTLEEIFKEICEIYKKIIP